MYRTCLILLSLLALNLPTIAKDSIAREKLPPDLKVADTQAWGWDPLKDCTSQVFTLDEAMARTIESHGLEAFATMSVPADLSRWRYAPFQPTPVDAEARESWNENGYVWAGLACGLSAAWQARSASIGTGPGAYYSFGRGVLLLVDPGQRLVVFTRRDSLH
jgi:hypothetical protein